MISKTGSHVSMIVSFVVFVTFIVFLFFILQPSLSVDKEKEDLLDHIEINLLNYFNTELNTISAKVNEGSSCVQLSGLSGMVGLFNDGDFLIIKNANGDILGYEIDVNGNVKIQSTVENTFFKIYQSTAITKPETTIGICTIGEYSLGLVKTEEKIFESDILNASALYQTNYDQLRQKVGLPSEDFGFDFIYENGTVISRGQPSQAEGVYTKQSSFYYLDNDLNTKYGSLLIKTW